MRNGLRMFYWKLKNGDKEATAVLTAFFGLGGTLVAATAVLLLPTYEDFVVLVSAACALIAFVLSTYLRHRRKQKSQQLAQMPYRMRHEEFRDVLLRSASPRVARVLENTSAFYIGSTPPDLRNASRSVDRGADLLWYPYIPCLTEKLSKDPQTRRILTSSLIKATKKAHAVWNPQTQRQDIGYNLPKALVFDEDLPPEGFTESAPIIDYIIADYVTFDECRKLLNSFASQDRPPRPRILGAGGILVHPTHQKVIIFQRRRLDDVSRARLVNNELRIPATYIVADGQNHVAAGDFEPQTNQHGLGYDRDLASCAEREILEELGLLVRVKGALVFAHKEQIDDRWYCPVHFCGLIVDDPEVKPQQSAEGIARWFNFEQLADSLKFPEYWVPAGWYSVMLWLYLGAPCQNAAPVFDPKRAREIFQSTLREICAADNKVTAAKLQ